MTSLRLLVLGIVGESPYLTARAYYNLAKEQQACSYQGVHKVLLQLVKEKVVKKNGETYSIALDWLNENLSFSKNALERLKDKEANYLEYDSYVDFSQGFIKVLDKEARRGTKDTLCVAYWRHTWPPTVLIGKAFDELNSIVNNSTPILYSYSKLPGDELLMKLYAQNGCKTKIGVKTTNQKYDWIAHKEFFAQVFFPDAFTKKLALVYKEENSEKMIAKLTKLMHEPCKISVIINMNEKLANAHRKKLF